MLELGDNANYLIRQILEAYYATASGSDTEENSSLSSGEG